uniref:Small subunit ribosomal protein 3 n=1 Tax=Ilyonectria sp. TaxID=1755430 RepID=A0A4Y5UZ48_9HYPO|nr:small subunit ribosomal protein 3 [Ilyonectria sp.]
MNNNIKMEIFNNNLIKNSKTIFLKKKIGDVGMIKYLPSFAKEWKNTIYSFNKNTLKNIPVNDININKIIKGYFNLYFKDNKYTGSKYILLKRRRNLLRRIHVSNAELKHTNNKAIITLYTINREKNVLKKKYLKINKRIGQRLIAKRYFLLYKNNIHKIYNILNKYKEAGVNNNERIFINDIIRKKEFIKYKLQYLNKFITLKNLYLKKVWGILLKNYARKYLRLLRKYDLLYSLNQYKFNNSIFLPILSNILNKIIGKNIEYNIINLKSVAYNTDLFTNALALKLRKKRINYMKNMFSILNRAYLPNVNTIKERSKGMIHASMFHTPDNKDLKIISNIAHNNLSNLLDGIYRTNTKQNHVNTAESIHNKIYDSVGYKNMGGIRLEVKGRLTKRYRADRSIYSLKWKGGLKNIDSSFKGLSSVLFRGNSKSNVTYSIAKSKRRIGAFAVKGWIGGK